MKGCWLDSHSEPVMDGVWGLVEEALRCTAAESLILEKDTKLHPYGLILRDLRRAKEIFYRFRPSQPDPQLPCWMHPGQTPVGDDGVDAFESEQFADLRNFQRAMIHIIRDKSYRKQFVADPDVIQENYPMGKAWQDRLAGFQPRALRRVGQQVAVLAAPGAAARRRVSPPGMAGLGDAIGGRPSRRRLIGKSPRAA